jgi:hypothetical protein
VKADPLAQRALLELAEIDTELVQLAHRRRTAPEIADTERTEKDLQAAKDAVVTAETLAGDLDRDARKQEAEIDQVRARTVRDKGLLTGANAKLQSELGHELGTLQRRQQVLEDELLELMERREAVELDVTHARDALAAAQDAVTEAVRKRDLLTADLDSTEQRRDGQRRQLLERMPAELVTLYDRIRTQKGGKGAALLNAKRCGACRLELDRSALATVRAAAPDEVVRCEECGAILVRTQASGI